jgi:hypothetical protein
MSNTKADIERSYRNFDIFGSAATEDANEIIAERTGEARGDMTEEDIEGSNGFEAPAPLSEAINMATLAQTPEFQQILIEWNEMIEDFTRKSKDERLTQDARTFNHNKAVGIEQALVKAGQIITAARDRLLNTSTDERALIGNDAKLLLSRLAQPPAPVVSDNTDALIESQVPKFKSASITKEENHRAVRKMIEFFESDAAPKAK